MTLKELVNKASVCLPESIRDKANGKREIALERQQHIDRFVQENPSPYISQVVYDSDKSLVISLIESFVARQQKEQAAKLSQNGLKHKVSGRYGNSNRFIRETHPIASTLQYFNDFARGLKSDIFIFPEAYKKESKFMGSEVPKISQDGKLRLVLCHEYSHTEDNYRGMDLGNGLIIDRLNWDVIHPSVANFIGETRAYLNQLEFSRQFGKDSQVYQYSLLCLRAFLLSNAHITAMSFNPYERRFLDYQKSRIIEVCPEFKSLLAKSS